MPPEKKLVPHLDLSGGRVRSLTVSHSDEVRFAIVGTCFYRANECNLFMVCDMSHVKHYDPYGLANIGKVSVVSLASGSIYQFAPEETVDIVGPLCQVFEFTKWTRTP